MPSLRDAQAWAVPATPDEIGVVMAYVTTIIEPEASEDRAAVLTRACIMRGWTRAEWLLVAREAPFRHHYGPTVRLAVLEDIVRASRELRALVLRHDLTHDQVAALIAADPELTLDSFGCAGYAPRTGEELFGLRMGHWNPPGREWAEADRINEVEMWGPAGRPV